jgi:hypothetical protein
MYVGISKSLQKDILAHIERMREAQLERVHASTHPFPDGLAGPEWAARIEKQAWGDPIKLKDKLPDNWLRPPNFVDVHFQADNDQTLSTRFSGSTIEFPPTYDGSYAPDVHFQLDDLEPQIAEDIRKHFRLTVEEEIMKLLERCKSLNEAVQLFPDLRYFLSDDIKDKLDRKRDGGKQEPDSRLEGIDTALITSAMVVEQLHPDKED